MKLKTKHYRDLVALLTDADLVSEDKKSASPERIAVHPNDYKKIKEGLTSVGKKIGMSEKQLQLAVGYELLNLGPVECKAVKEGYAIINPYEYGQGKE